MHANRRGKSQHIIYCYCVSIFVEKRPASDDHTHAVEPVWLHGARGSNTRAILQVVQLDSMVMYGKCNLVEAKCVQFTGRAIGQACNQTGSIVLAIPLALLVVQSKIPWPVTWGVCAVKAVCAKAGIVDFKARPSILEWFAPNFGTTDPRRSFNDKGKIALWSLCNITSA